MPYKQFVLDQGKKYVLVALYTQRGKLIRIKRIGRALKVDRDLPPPKRVD